MKRETVRERPFEYLRRRETNEPFPEATVRNWYIARSYVLDKLKDVAFIPDSPEHLHAVVVGDSPLMRAVVRQLALSSHFINFVEYDALDRLVCRNRTVITLVTGLEAPEILRELEKEEYLCNVLKHTRHSVFGKIENADAYLDIEFEIVKELPPVRDCVLMTDEDAEAFVQSRTPEELFTIDTRKAVYASRVYCLGAVIDNLPYEDIHSAGRYNRALDTFRYKVLNERDGLRLVTPKWNDLAAARNGISNIFSADCFESRERAVRQLYPGGRKLSERERSAIWEKNNDALSLSEHCRWVVEKLVMGFCPLNDRERAGYDNLFGAKRALFTKELKNDAARPVHIDIRSYRDLCRVDPDILKYDSFLMLAIPLILDNIRG